MTTLRQSRTARLAGPLAVLAIIMMAASCAKAAGSAAGVSDSAEASSASSAASAPTHADRPSQNPAATSVAPQPAPAVTAPPVTAPPLTLPPPAAIPTTDPPTTSTAVAPGPVHHAFPVLAGQPASYPHTHAGYPATDVFTNCGNTYVSPVDGVISEVRRIDRYTKSSPNPAFYGGRSVAIIGDDGVRYYGAHFEDIPAETIEGRRVAAGDPIAVVGRAGDASACHIHFGISPPCPSTEWAVRRGAVWPWSYLDAWREGDSRSPRDEVTAWSASHPNACADAAAMPTARDGIDPFPEAPTDSVGG
jgi:peptidoglycan LD-endopeptidase LytH